jgi:hypothetical protein
MGKAQSLRGKQSTCEVKLLFGVVSCSLSVLFFLRRAMRAFRSYSQTRAFLKLTDLAGLAAPLALVPPLSGRSLASIVHDPAHGVSPRKFALTQFSRCPITASEFLRDIQGKGPLVMQAQVSIDYRTRPDKGAQVGNWECAWKGWEWSLQHDLVLMGYSIRSDKWRYTAWVLWNSNTTLPIWTYPPFGEELYAHPMGANEVS